MWSLPGTVPDVSVESEAMLVLHINGKWRVRTCSMIVVYSAFGGFPASPFDSIYYCTVKFVPHLICLDVVIPSRGQGGGSQPKSAGGMKIATPNSQGADREIQEFQTVHICLLF